MADALINIVSTNAALDEREALVLEALVAARRDPTVRIIMRRRLGRRQKILAQLLTADRSLRDDLEPAAVAWLAYALSLGLLLSRATHGPTPSKATRDEALRAIAAALHRRRRPSVS